MIDKIHHDRDSRRAFLKGIGACGAALAIGSKVHAASLSDWRKLIGIQLTVVRDEMLKDVESTLAKVAAIGYKYVNPVGFSGVDAKTYRAMLDRHGLIAPQIDLGFRTGPDMEKDLESCQILGIKYAEPAMPGLGGRPPGRPPAFVPETLEAAKRTAAEYNAYGKIARKFGIMVIFHNHVEHFELLANSKSTLFDVFLAETDPETVGMEFDLGYTAIAGRNIPQLIRQYPGRLPVWDVRDAFGIKNADAHPGLTPSQRMPYTYLVPVGVGDVDFKTIFAGAETAGLKYFFVQQNNAPTWGDSIAAARVSFENLTKILA